MSDRQGLGRVFLLLCLIVPHIFFLCSDCPAGNATDPKNPAPGQTWTEPSTGMEFVWVPGGCFQMGCDSWQFECEEDEKPVHEVCLDGFWMGKYEVTNAQYRMFKPFHFNPKYRGHSLDGPSQPVAHVDWNGAGNFAAWLSARGNGVFRLPTEAEWEYAARGGNEKTRFWGDSPDQACAWANVGDRAAEKAFSRLELKTHACDDGFAVSAPVGSFKPNRFGLYDMLGNVWEWCEDVYDEKAYQTPSRPGSSGDERAVRGGSWYNKPRFVRSAFRFSYDPGVLNRYLGFRLVRTP